MDIKLKNRYIQLGALALALLLLALSLLAGMDFWYNRRTIRFTNYFETTDFQSSLSGEFGNIRLLYDNYENFENKTDDEKINKDELKQMKENYDNNLKNLLNQTEESYKQEINQADEVKNADKVKRLIEERDKKLEQLKKENTRTVEDVKYELVARNTKDYEIVKKSVENNNNVKYYFWDSNNKTYTNIKNAYDISGYDIGEYVKTKALYSILFPVSESGSNDLSFINTFLQDKGLKGYVIIPNESADHSYFQENLRYYNASRIRAISKFFIAIITLILGLQLLKYLKKNSIEALVYIDKFKNLCLKLPVDIRFIILFFYTLLIMEFRYSGITTLSWPNSDEIITCFLTAVYILFAYTCLPYIKALFEDKGTLKEYWEDSLTLKLHHKLTKGIKNKGLFFRIFIFLIIALMGAVTITLLTLATSNNEGAALFVLFIYCFCVMIYMIFKGKHLNEIIRATDEIASGNLNYNLKEKGNSILSKMAHNINNLQEGVKKSVESQMKSDRLKSELITNVSHDLKTPLTSIINYVDLLKREDLSKEEMNDYIAVLDRKTQRLKVLIEDLFEASKMASGSVELNIEKVDVAQLLNQALAEFEEKIKASDLTFKVTIPSQKVYANLDGKKTWRVFENLIGNILKYSQGNTRVYVSLYESEDKVSITMKNISAYELNFDVEEIYERFKRGDASRHTEGSGLGLAIAKSIVDLHGGSMSIDTDGDLFKVTVEFKK